MHICACAKSKFRCARGAPKENNTKDSNVVPHRSTNLARTCLTSQSRRDAVLSCLYGRSHQYHHNITLIYPTTHNNQSITQNTNTQPQTPIQLIQHTHHHTHIITYNSYNTPTIPSHIHPSLTTYFLFFCITLFLCTNFCIFFFLISIISLFFALHSLHSPVPLPNHLITSLFASMHARLGPWYLGLK